MQGRFPTCMAETRRLESHHFSFLVGISRKLQSERVLGLKSRHSDVACSILTTNRNFYSGLFYVFSLSELKHLSPFILWLPDSSYCHAHSSISDTCGPKLTSSTTFSGFPICRHRWQALSASKLRNQLRIINIFFLPIYI